MFQWTFKQHTPGIYYCKECNKLMNNCYELDGVNMCYICFSEDLKFIPEIKIKAFIRNKSIRLFINKGALL